jgi:hypothetical protein
MEFLFRKDNYGLLTVLLVTTLVSRIPFRAHIPYGLDSVQFVLGMDHYDVRLHQPHPPGYFIFVMMGRLIRKLFYDPSLSLIVLNILFSTLAVWLVFDLGKEIFGAESGLYSAALLATSPVFWFHGDVALSNVGDCFFVCLLSQLCWKNLKGDVKPIYPSAFVLGLAGGFRQNTLLFMFPLWILSVRRAGLKRIASAITFLILTVAAWYLPMAQLSGGISAYQSALRDHWLNSNWHGFTLEWIPFNFICVGYFILLGTSLGIVFLLLGGLFYLEKERSKEVLRSCSFQFFVSWLAPALGFFLFIYSHPIQTGHSLIYLPALLILMPFSIRLSCQKIINLFRSTQTQLHGAPMESRECNKPFSLACKTIMLLLISCNIFMFLCMNTAVSQRTIRQYESKVGEIVAAVRAHWTPNEVILLNYDFMFLGFRDFMYHLPEYRTYQPRPYFLGGRPLLFSGFQRETRLVSQITVPSSITSFVLNADEFIKNPELIHGVRLKEFPGELVTTPSGSRLFRGKIQDFVKFFPQVQIKCQ